MKIERKSINDVLVIIPDVYRDERGYFFESYNKSKLPELPDFVQDNQSYSVKNVIRGLHYQRPPYEQAKLVRALRGKILDVAVDIRKDSPTYGKYVSEILSEDNFKQLFIPRGFAHGFSVLSDEAIVLYKTDNFYNKESEGGIVWNDSKLGIDWMVDNPIVSEKDRALGKFK
ncbi:MAG: dTDP-4-dehydrorhamnose 3,5-epimerase [Candidatus Woesearchaeota archaeon]|nr:dTDP-4-dehydrorhamnose 3,5-epimerase [Candidatus Woesearchaeota archaeon]